MKKLLTTLTILSSIVLLSLSIYVWSGGGLDYAKQKMRELKLPEEVRCLANKTRNPHIAITIDDRGVKLGTINIRV